MKQEQTKTTSAPRKKKAARACIHCQKVHNFFFKKKDFEND